MDHAVDGNVGTLESLALSKGVSAWVKSQEDNDLPVGDHVVDAQYLVHVTGTLTRGEDTSRKATSSIPWKLFAAVVFEKAGITGEPARRMISAALNTAMTLGKDKKEALSGLLLYLEDAEAEVQKLINALPRTPVKGPLSADLDVTVERVTSVNSVRTPREHAVSRSA